MIKKSTFKESLISSIKEVAIYIILIVVVIISVHSYLQPNLFSTPPARCKGPYKNMEAYMGCVIAKPEVGKWKAVYTAEFAKKYNLPSENISTDFSQGVDYMEMDVQSYAEEAVGCLVNMLVKRPNDIAFHQSKNYKKRSWVDSLNNKRKLARFINLDSHKGDLKEIYSLSSASRDYKYNTKGFMTTADSFYVENVFGGYDYITVIYSCGDISLNPSYIPDNFAVQVSRASVWGKYDNKYLTLDSPGRPKGDDLYNSHFFINIPKELIIAIFKNVPVGGK